MEALVLNETDKLVTNWKAGGEQYDGLIYTACVHDDGERLRISIGKAETVGKGDGNLSANISNLHNDKSKFARWGDSYAYHIGDLSAVALPGHPPEKRTAKYESWAKALFESFPAECPRLKVPV